MRDSDSEPDAELEQSYEAAIRPCNNRSRVCTMRRDFL
jgi:hypothetical protein